MHTSISSYLTSLADKGRSPLTIKAAHGDLAGFAAWWESRYSRPFDPALLRPNDLQTWRLSRQKDDAAAPATINRTEGFLRVSLLLIEMPRSDSLKRAGNSHI